MKSEAHYREMIDSSNPITQWWGRKQLGKLGILTINPNNGRFVPARHLYPVPADYELSVEPTLVSDETLPQDIKMLLETIRASLETKDS